MPTRMLREGILTSERVNSLSDRAELFYRRLMSVVDDYGRYTANPTLLRAACYPLKLDAVKEDSIKKHLAEAAGAGLIVLYTVGGKEYLEIQDFGQRIQSKSKFPAPVEPTADFTPDSSDPPGSTVDHGGPPEKTALVGVGVGVEDGGVTRPRRARRASPKTPLPDGFAISDRVKKWAEEKGFDRLEDHHEAFVSKAKARAYTYADWDEAFMGAVRDDWAEIRKGAPQVRQRRQL